MTLLSMFIFMGILCTALSTDNSSDVNISIVSACNTHFGRVAAFQLTHRANAHRTFVRDPFAAAVFNVSNYSSQKPNREVVQAKYRVVAARIALELCPDHINSYEEFEKLGVMQEWRSDTHKSLDAKFDRSSKLGKVLLAEVQTLLDEKVALNRSIELFLVYPKELRRALLVFNELGPGGVIFGLLGLGLKAIFYMTSTLGLARFSFKSNDLSSKLQDWKERQDAFLKELDDELY